MKKVQRGVLHFKNPNFRSATYFLCNCRSSLNLVIRGGEQQIKSYNQKNKSKKYLDIRVGGREGTGSGGLFANKPCGFSGRK